MLCIIPAGHVTYVSSLYTGYISDSQLVQQYGFLSLLQKGYEIMADCGFTIEDLFLLLGIKLNTAPFLVENVETQ